jgi:phosphoribosylformylglycinamidine cyclo-ligase
VVISLQSTSFRSNGYSALRRGLSAHLGESYHEVLLEGRAWGDWLLEPCRIYAPFVVRLRRAGLEPHGLAHITGGGLPSKFGRTLRATGLGAALTSPFAPTAAMCAAVELCGLSWEEAYRHWNMGNGFLVVVAPALADAVLHEAEHAGYAAQRAGVITPEPQLTIAAPSRGTPAPSPERELTYLL